MCYTYLPYTLRSEELPIVDESGGLFRWNEAGWEF